jgi:hypothetical protein
MKPLRKEHRPRANNELGHSQPLHLAGYHNDHELLPLQGVVSLEGMDQDMTLETADQDMTSEIPSFWLAAQQSEEFYDSPNDSRLLDAAWTGMDFPIDTRQDLVMQSPTRRPFTALTAPQTAAEAQHPELASMHNVSLTPARTMLDGIVRADLSGKNSSAHNPVTQTLPNQIRPPHSRISARQRSSFGSHSTHRSNDVLRDAVIANNAATDSHSSSPNVVSDDIDLQAGPNTTFDWPANYTLESKNGYSYQAIGLSCETDPYVLRYYNYDMNDAYRMFRLDFRKMVDDSHFQRSTSMNRSRLPVDPVPVQFMMVDEEIWKDGLHAAEQLFKGPSSSAGDSELLDRLVSPDLGIKLLKLFVIHGLSLTNL